MRRQRRVRGQLRGRGELRVRSGAGRRLVGVRVFVGVGDPGGDRRALPRRRLQRGQRPHRERDRPQRHHPQLRVRVRGRRGRRVDRHPQGPRHRRRRRPPPGAAVYLWHCDREGRYSLYAEGITDENYLRGVQETAADGKVTFKSIFPAAYSGRWPHIHFEVYPSLDAATTASGKLRTSQLAFPEAPCRQVYATDGYTQSLQNLSQTSLDTDMVFSDGYSLQLAKVTGDVANGYTATLNVPV